MAYVSLYRKWRPQTFEEVLGQEYVTRTLANSLRNGNFSHAYLFTGPRGTGKTSTARILAKALNCEEGPTPRPCNRCTSCREITEGASVDVVEVDAASSRGIDDIRELRERVVFSPAAARIKVYILDEAHMLTKEAFNAFLKTLEEPPQHVVFVLATTEPHKMPQTILSRCQRYDFRGVSVKRLAEHLAAVSESEGVKASERALRLIARRAKGSARDALVLLEQVMSYGDGEVDEADVAGFLGMVEDELLVELGDRLAAGDAAGAVAVLERAYEEGKDLAQLARGAREHFRRVFLLQHAGFSAEELEVDEVAYESIRRQAECIPPARVHHFIAALGEAEREMRSDSSPRLLLESAVVGMALEELDTSPEALSARMERLEGEMERALRRGAAPAPATPGPAGMPPGADRAVGVAQEEEAGGIGAGVPGESREAAPDVEAGKGLGRTEEAPLDMAAIKRSWPQIRERVKERKITVHALLLEGRPAEIRGGELVISFPGERAFHRGEMEKDANKGTLEAAVEDVLGVRLKVTTRLEEGTRAAARRPMPGGAGPKAASVDEEKASRGGAAAPAEGHPAESRKRRPKPLPADALAGEEGPARIREEEPALGGLDREPGRPARTGRSGNEAGHAREGHDAGRVKLVKDIFGAEIIEEIAPGE